MKCLTVTIWIRIFLLRYQGVWLIAEASCMLCGLSYNGRTKDGEILWNGVCNIEMIKLEFGNTCTTFIESYNCSTNQWASRYIFKRLYFLGNKIASHIITLLFLALWHGFYSGYFACFGFEFIHLFNERMVMMAFSGSKWFESLTRTPEIMMPLFLLRQFIVLFGGGFAFLAFSLFTFNRWIEVHKRLYFVGWIVGAILPIILTQIIKSNSRRNTKKVKENHEG